MRVTTVYKVTSAELQTHGSYQWVIGKWSETSGKGDLCGSGWLHAYSHPLIAVLVQPLHGNLIARGGSKLWKAEGAGEYKDENGLKCGYSKIRIIEEIEIPEVTTVHRVAFAILCAKKVYTDPKWNAWADKWLSREDRSAGSARAAARVSVTAAALAAEAAEAARAAYAAEAAAWAADFSAMAAKKPLNLISLAEQALEVKQ